MQMATACYKTSNRQKLGLVLCSAVKQVTLLPDTHLRRVDFMC